VKHTPTWKEYQHWFWISRAWRIFDPYVQTQAILRLDISTLCGESEEDTIKLSRLVRERHGFRNVGWTAPVRYVILTLTRLHGWWGKLAVPIIC